MGDDNEIRQLIRRESETFLAKAFKEAEGKGTTYDLEKEFAQTARNRSPIVVVATLATIAALGAVAFGVTRIIEGRTAAAPVDVTAFEDLNLKDILDTAKRNESDMERARLEMEKLDYDLKNGVETADRNYQAAAESIKAQGLPSSDESMRLKDAAALAAREKLALKEAYASQSKRKMAEIADLQKRIDQYDQRLTEQAKKQQELLDNERRIFDFEKKKQTDFYEARIAALEAARSKDVATLKRQKEDLAASITSRYNPKLADERSAALLSGYSPPASVAPQVEMNPYIETAGVAAPGSGTALRRSLSDFLFLSSKLRSVPYLNSVPPALARMEAEARESVALYSGALSRAGTGLQERDARIRELSARAEAAERALASYRWAIDQYVRESREGGYVLDPRDPSSLSVALNPGVPVVDGSSGYVVRGDKAVAALSFYAKDGAMRARVVELAEGESIRPFDSVLVEASPGAAK
jgi:hypothetical protein